MVSNGFAEKTQRGCCITFGGQQKVDGLAVAVNSLVQIFPLTFDFYIDFIYFPPPTYCALMPAKYLIKGTRRMTQRCNVEWSTRIPRSAIISSRLRKLSE